jgi:hypothetical protein
MIDPTPDRVTVVGQFDRNQCNGDAVPDIDLPVNQRYGNSITTSTELVCGSFRRPQRDRGLCQFGVDQKSIGQYRQLHQFKFQGSGAHCQSGIWDAAVDTYADLTYIDTRDISGTANYLVRADEENSNGFWAIYQWDGTVFSRTRVQTYNTSAYYRLADWYVDRLQHRDTVIDRQVTYQYQLDTLTSLGTDTQSHQRRHRRMETVCENHRRMGQCGH